MIDRDADGQIRVNEVLAAIEWTGSLLKNPDLLIKSSESLALSDINDTTDEGKLILSTARHIAKCLGKPEEAAISIGDISQIETFIAAQN